MEIWKLHLEELLLTMRKIKSMQVGLKIPVEYYLNLLYLKKVMI